MPRRYFLRCSSCTVLVNRRKGEELFFLKGGRLLRARGGHPFPYVDRGIEERISGDKIGTGR